VLVEVQDLQRTPTGVSGFVSGPLVFILLAKCDDFRIGRARLWLGDLIRRVFGQGVFWMFHCALQERRGRVTGWAGVDLADGNTNLR